MNFTTVGRLACTLIAVASVAGCGGGSDSEIRDLSFSPLEANLYGEWPVQTYVVRTRAELVATWAQHDSLQSPPAEMPEVDFSAYTVVGVSLGWGPSGCHGLRIARAFETRSDVRVLYQRLVPTGAGLCTGSLVPLVAFVKIPATLKPVAFAETGD